MNREANGRSFKLLLLGHGSRTQSGHDAFEAFAGLFRERFPDVLFRHAYLEFNRPTIDEAAAELVASGASLPIVVVPALLAAATHVKNDIPIALKKLEENFPDQSVQLANVIDLHASILQLSAQRIREAEASASQLVAREDTCLVVVGRGTSDPDANGNIAKIARMLHEGLGFGASYVCYSGTTFPLVADGLRQAARLGYKRLIVFPYFLFDGILVQRIYSAADALQRRGDRALEVVKANYLGIEPAIADIFMERALEAVAGLNFMNCQTCKYRAPIVGYENEQFREQKSHRGKSAINPYSMHPIERESFSIIGAKLDSGRVCEESRPIVERLIHTTGDFSVADDLFISSGAVQIGVNALLRCRRVVTDVTMVQAGLRRALLRDLEIATWCAVHDTETWALSEKAGITRSAAGIRRAFMEFGNDVVLAIGDAPTAVLETVRLIGEQNWRPQLVVGLPVGFVGTAESKEALKGCLQVPRITNSGTRGGSPWAAAVINSLLIEACRKVTGGSSAVEG